MSGLLETCHLQQYTAPIYFKGDFSVFVFPLRTENKDKWTERLSKKTNHIWYCEGKKLKAINQVKTLYKRLFLFKQFKYWFLPCVLERAVLFVTLTFRLPGEDQKLSENSSLLSKLKSTDKERDLKIKWSYLENVKYACLQGKPHYYYKA